MNTKNNNTPMVTINVGENNFYAYLNGQTFEMHNSSMTTVSALVPTFLGQMIEVEFFHAEVIITRA
jgi:hypothetical protein